MARHDFKCANCGTTFEVEATIQEGPPLAAACPCGGLARKVFDGNSGRFALRGSGWSGRQAMMKKSLTERNKRLSTSQWENHEAPTPVGKPRNPTPGGPFDPNRGKLVG